MRPNPDKNYHIFKSLDKVCFGPISKLGCRKKKFQFAIKIFGLTFPAPRHIDIIEYSSYNISSTKKYYGGSGIISKLFFNDIAKNRLLFLSIAASVPLFARSVAANPIVISSKTINNNPGLVFIVFVISTMIEALIAFIMTRPLRPKFSELLFTIVMANVIMFPIAQAIVYGLQNTSVSDIDDFIAELVVIAGEFAICRWRFAKMLRDGNLEKPVPDGGLLFMMFLSNIFTYLLFPIIITEIIHILW